MALEMGLAEFNLYSFQLWIAVNSINNNKISNIFDGIYKFV